MNKCGNCDKNATVIVKHVASLDQYFCDEHLPKFYKGEQVHSVHDILVPMATPETAPKPAKKKAVAKASDDAAEEKPESTEAADESAADSN